MSVIGLHLYLFPGSCWDLGSCGDKFSVPECFRPHCSQYRLQVDRKHDHDYAALHEHRPPIDSKNLRSLLDDKSNLVEYSNLLFEEEALLSSDQIISTSVASPSSRGSLREVPTARRGPPVPLERGDCAKLGEAHGAGVVVIIIIHSFPMTSQSTTLRIRRPTTHGVHHYFECRPGHVRSHTPNTAPSGDPMVHCRWALSLEYTK
ncbi:hypothetical protein PGT21_002924 [Puccinia graminis f. sp. tritici]|uniref:Uncharacterized protein n=1 Tax=Puccinia graminis f. sp. tritici TaxID=56615 RepID=A0A5B0QE64_PUCGR|nr:hypothetical protein PGT21_002924 [Puccinia graminis f. sp. tritici]